jgi:hypothetical protein
MLFRSIDDRGNPSMASPTPISSARTLAGEPTFAVSGSAS